MSDEINRTMNLLIRKKFPEKILKYFEKFDSNSVWVRSVEKFDKINEEFYCLYCDQLLDFDYKQIYAHGLQHIKENNLAAFI